MTKTLFLFLSSPPVSAKPASVVSSTGSGKKEPIMGGPLSFFGAGGSGVLCAVVVEEVGFVRSRMTVGFVDDGGLEDEEVDGAGRVSREGSMTAGKRSSSSSSSSILSVLAPRGNVTRLGLPPLSVEDAKE
jgi:hypothetical protein